MNRSSAKKDAKEIRCRYCGSPLDSEALYCGNCGIYIYQLTTDLPGNRVWKDNTLGQCGYCSNLIPADRTYCIFCGMRHPLSKRSSEIVERNRRRVINCTITFNLEQMTDQEIRSFTQYIGKRLRMSKCAGDGRELTVKCGFNCDYDEPTMAFSDEMIYSMVSLLLSDISNKYPSVCATAYCSYGPRLVNMVNRYDDMGGFVTITLKDGIIDVDDTPII